MIFCRGEAAQLREVGAKIGRDRLAERALEIARGMVESGDYRRAIAGAGQLFAIATACGGDSYWREKADSGTVAEIDYLDYLAQKVATYR